MTHVSRLADLDVWRELTKNDIADYDDEPVYTFPTAELYEEINRRWGKDALERVAQVITSGHFSPDDELRWLDESPESFMRLVRGVS